ncbi:unnamed protein product, partial [Rotaria sp. Silwood2]
MSKQAKGTSKTGQLKAQHTLVDSSDTNYNQERNHSATALPSNMNNNFKRGAHNHHFSIGDRRCNVPPPSSPYRGRASDGHNQRKTRSSSTNNWHQDSRQTDVSNVKEKPTSTTFNMRHRSNSRTKFSKRSQSVDNLSTSLPSMEDIKREFETLYQLIIMSATGDSKLLQKYYNGACLFEFSDEMFPIEDEYALEEPKKYVEAAVKKALEIHESQDPGDILVFLTGPDEIDRAITEFIEKVNHRDTIRVLPLHGKLSEQETQAVFTPTSPQKRKIVFATNIAETSITIDGIQYVIDSGMVKEIMWDSEKNTQTLKVRNTTQSSVKQRRGRAGRTAPGK